MKYCFIVLLALISVSCDFTGVVDNYTSSIVMFDSLKVDIKPELGDGITTRVYEDTIPAASCPGMIYKFTVHNQELASYGVYELSVTMIEAEDGKDVVFKESGKWSTMTGIPSDSTAIVYRFIEFPKADTLNLLYNAESLTFLSKNMETAESKLNYTLPIQSKVTITIN